MPDEQTPEFNRLIVLMNATNVHLPLYITMVAGHCEQLGLRFSWLLTLSRFGMHTYSLAGLIPASKRVQAEKIVADSYPAVELPWRGDELEQSWVNVSERALAALRGDLIGLWQELKAIDIVLDEVAHEFDGEDALRPVIRGIFEKARYRLTELHAILSAVGPFDLPEPDEDSLELARTFFDNGRRLMERI